MQDEERGAVRAVSSKCQRNSRARLSIGVDDLDDEILFGWHEDH
jgi:hypothetical protein